MGRTLRFYVIREVALPTLLALLTITFILLMGMIRSVDLMSYLMQPGVRLSQILLALATMMPSMLTMAVPMALLIGSLIGVGRLVLDREVLAMRASGVNMFSIFMPFLAVALLASLSIMALSANVLPNLMFSGVKRISELSLAIFNAMEPGQVHDQFGPKDGKFAFNLNLGDKDNKPSIYFETRDPKTMAMKDVVLKLERQVATSESHKADKAEEKLDHRLAQAAALGGDKTSTLALAADRSASATAGAAGKAEAPGQKPEKKSKKDKNKDGRLSAAKDRMARRNMELTTIFAESGTIESRLHGASPDGQAIGQDVEIVLTLLNGTIHRLAPDPARRDYVTIRFDRFEKQLFEKTMKQRPRMAQPSGQLSADADRLMAKRKAQGKLSKNERELLGQWRKELAERRSICWASFVFALIGVPLAIRLRPTGKSWGILLAIVLMLVYYVLMRLGLTMVEAEKPLGLVLAFLPNLLFLGLGAGLWWQTVRS